jgi:hypothetical protein
MGWPSAPAPSCLSDCESNVFRLSVPVFNTDTAFMALPALSTTHPHRHWFTYTFEVKEKRAAGIRRQHKSNPVT